MFDQTDRIDEAKRLAKAAGALQQGIMARDHAACVEGIGACISFDATHFERYASDKEAELRRTMLEIVDVAIRGVLLADDAPADEWKRLMLPGRHGVLGYSSWMSNGRWLRTSGSPLPDSNDVVLDPKALAAASLDGQARQLGRYCFVNDGARPVDLEAVLDALDPRLVPFFVDWVLSVYSISPTGLPEVELEQRQEDAVELMTRFLRSKALPGLSFPISTVYDRPYRSDANNRDCASAVAGGVGGSFLSTLRGFVPPTDLPEAARGGLAAAEANGSLIITSNWRDSHVSFRCMAPLLEGMRTSGAGVLQPQTSKSPFLGQLATGWEGQSFEWLGEEEQPLMLQNATLCNSLAEADLDFIFYPEVTPANSTAWLATQRLARVQATGYGYPITTGSPHMDYFIGGSEIEGPSAGEHYSEQLVLLPGLGVSTTEPPPPSHARTRPVDDDVLHVVSCSTLRKLKRPLLSAWREVLSFGPARMDLFPAMQPRELALYVPAMAETLGDAAVDLHPVVERQTILDTLVEADLYLDSYPFGGFNSLVEVLTCGCPFVTLEGDQARNRFGAALLRRLEMPDFLIARSWHEYVAAARRVLSDASLRADLRARLADRDKVLATLADPDVHEHFEAARDWMVERGPRPKRAGAPVFIRAGERPLTLNA